MKKNNKRNELSIFEELRLKPSTNARSTEHYPREYSLHKLNVLCKVDKKNNPISWWKKRPNGEFMQVNEFGEMIFSSDKRYEKTIPKSKNLKKNKSKILVTVNKYNMPVTYWVKDNEGNLIQVNLKEEDVGVEMIIKSWLRDKAIDAVGLEIRSMKKKAYEYSKDELMDMIEKEESKLIKKGGWKAVRIAALSALGLPFLGFL